MSENNDNTKNNDKCDIKRYYIPLKPLIVTPNKIIPFIAFYDYNNMMNDYSIKNAYQKWKKCKDPNTNENIQYKSEKYYEIRERFKIDCVHSNRSLYKDDKNTFYLDDIEPLIGYNREAKYYYNQILDMERMEKKKNEILQYNIGYTYIRHSQNAMSNWNDFIEFDGVKYGFVDKVKDDKHIENNCFGDMEYISDYEYKCTYCLTNGVDRNNVNCFCKYKPKTHYKIYKCNKCNYEYKTENTQYKDAITLNKDLYRCMSCIFDNNI